MFNKIVLPLLAVIGLSFGVFMVFWSSRRPPEHPILFEPPTSPYAHYVAGEGLIESINENINLGVTFPDLIWDVCVEVGQEVVQGQLLFKVDTRQQEADLKEAYCQLVRAKSRYDDRKEQFRFFQDLSNRDAVSQREYIQAYYDKQIAWDEIKVAYARVEQIRTTIERAHVRAPYDGQILQDNVRPGEFANVNPFNRIPLMVFGDTKKMQLRVNIAEEDAWRVMAGAPGMAYVRGNKAINIPLQFKYIEPLLVPKQSLTGADSERVDTRVLQVVYEFERSSRPIYAGQLLDVFLEAQPSAVS